MKQCRGCNETLAFDKFYKNHCRKDGYNDLCKECAKEKENARRLKKRGGVAKVTKQEVELQAIPVQDQVTVGMMWKTTGGGHGRATAQANA